MSPRSCLHVPFPRLALSAGLALLLSAAPRAQISDPPVPQGGFALTRVMDQPVTYKDGAKTLMDVRYPSAGPGPHGWPVIIMVHGIAGSRAEVKANAELYASQGYVTVAYDVRGQGAAIALNETSLGSELIGRSERLDLAEIVAIVKTGFGNNGLADVSRLGITGFSQGGAHSWAAAAYSGRTLPANNRGIKTFPVFKAAVPLGFSPITPETLVVGKQAFSQPAASVILLPPALVEYEPTLQQKVVAAMAAGDTASALAILADDPWRQDLEYLKSSTVPVSVSVQWNDTFAPVEQSVRALDAMPKTTPTRALLTTLFSHDEPRNLRQMAQSRASALQWFNRFLKGMDNHADTEPRFVTSVVAESLALHKNQNTLLWHRYHPTWTPAGTRGLKFYLRQGQALSSQAPTTVESPETIQHRVEAGWDMKRYVTGGAVPANLAKAFVLSSTAYDTEALQTPVEIVGSPSLELEVTPQGSSTDYQLHCALYQVPANGPERYLQTGVAVVTANSKAQRLSIDFHDINVYIPTGDKLRLRIENLTQRYPAGVPNPFNPLAFNYYTIPFFVNSDVAIEHTAARPSWFEIPIADTIQPGLTSATLDVDTRVSADIAFNLDGTPLVAGGAYFLAFGASGISPGTTLPRGGIAQINTDHVTAGLLGLLNSTFLPNTLGGLDPMGRTSQPRIGFTSFPGLAPALVGLRLNAIAIVTSNGRLLASNPLDLYFR